MPRDCPDAPEWQAPESDHETITLHLMLITPMFGGGYEPREVDTVCPIRAAAIRGHLRFWWRALNGGQYASPDKLLEAEAELWGTMSKPGKVRIHVVTVGSAEVQNGDIAMSSPDAYALWPARATSGDDPKPPAERIIKKGLKFEIRVTCRSEDQAEVEEVLRAWVLFGGVGGRTRRGCGSITVTDHLKSSYLPSGADKAALTSLLPSLSSPHTAQQPLQIATLAGAHVIFGSRAVNDPLQAWYESLKWLREFRQGHQYGAGDRAREPDPNGRNRPSVSNWPEADKVRHVLGKPHSLNWAHVPRHNATPAWPRAGFGLPIVGQFQQESRSGNRWKDRGEFEPRGFEIIWCDGADKERDRLASPLILKPLALANGQFVACAVWLNRANPNGQACLRGRQQSRAPFDMLVAPGDKARYAPLGQYTSLRDAFFGWVATHFVVQQGVLP